MLTILFQEPVRKTFNTQDPHRDSNGSTANHQDPPCTSHSLSLIPLHKLTPNRPKRKADVRVVPATFPDFRPPTMNTHL